MWSRSQLGVGLLFLSILSCSPGAAESPADGAWVGTLTAEGNVVTVLNESGSMWGGTARLVEELSIGSELGDSPYLLGRITSFDVHDDCIVLLDGQVPAVRVYDRDGIWLHDIGRTGQGPGEFGEGFSGPIGLAVHPDGLVYVHNRDTIEIFTIDGEYRDTWESGESRATSGFAIAAPATDEVVVAEYLAEDRELFFWDRRVGLRTIRGGAIAADLLPAPDLEYKTPRIVRSIAGGGTAASLVPFAPALVLAIGSNGDIVVGRADRFEFEILRYGGERMVVSKWWEPIPVDTDEAAWHERRVRLDLARQEATSESGYDIDDGLPATRPAFETFLPTRDGGVWVVRPGPGREVPDCAAANAELSDMNENPCWESTYILDAFDPAGRYLGEVEIPPVFYNKRFRKFSPPPVIQNDAFIAAVEDDAGTIMVKRYRLVPPGNEQ